MIDGEKIQQIRDLIFEHRAFRIGGRGICIDCYPEYENLRHYWRIEIPRAFVEMECSIIDIESNDYFVVMNFYRDIDSRTPCAVINLKTYSKITRFY